jgi:hypothetical protein
MILFKIKEMGKLKEQLLNNMSEEEYYQAKSDYEAWVAYEEWLQSDGYMDMINEEISKTWPIYSVLDLEKAILHAIDGISVDPSEVGKDVYGKLFHEKAFEYLTNRQ